MRKIKLTESQLNKIIVKIISEQTNYLRGKPSIKRGDRGEEVKSYQQILINMGFDLGPQGADGKFGGYTEKIVKRFQAGQNLPQTGVIDQQTRNLLDSAGNSAFFKPQIGKQTTQKTQVKTSAKAPENTNLKRIEPVDQGGSFFEKAKEFCMSPFRRIQSFKNMVSEKVLSAVSQPHLRAFLFFLLGRTEPITERFFTTEELDAIKNKINNTFTKDKMCVRNKNCTISFYEDTNWANVKKGTETQISVPLVKSIGFTLGNANVSDKGSYYLVRDIYDFNNYEKNPSAYTFENADDTIKTALKKITCGNYIQGIEELASFKQAAGYKGIPVEITIQKNT